jgi:general stress protein CsbA
MSTFEMMMMMMMMIVTNVYLGYFHVQWMVEAHHPCVFPE